MKNQDFKSFLQSADADPMQIGEEEAKAMQGEIRVALAKPLHRFIDSEMGLVSTIALFMVGLFIPAVFLGSIASIYAFDPSLRSANGVSMAFGVVLWFVFGLALFQLKTKIHANLKEVEKADVLLSFVDKNDNMVKETLDLCLVAPKAQEILSNLRQSNRSVRMVHLNAMRRLCSQRLADQ